MFKKLALSAPKLMYRNSMEYMPFDDRVLMG